MELNYEGKVPCKEILAKIRTAEPIAMDEKSSYLIKGNNFDILLALLKSGLSGKIDLIYIDPPFNTKQTFTIEGERASTISRSKSSFVAYSDKMTPAEYLEFMRERLILLKELLSDNGSIYLHIDSKMGHYMKIIMDEIFGIENFKNDISRIKSNPKNFSRKAYGNQKDVILFYAKNKNANIFNNVTTKLTESEKTRMFAKIDGNGRRYNTVPVHAPGETTNGETGNEWNGMLPPKGRHWRTSPRELDELDKQCLIEWSKNGVPRLKKYADEHKGKKIQDIWDYIDPAYPLYPTEKNLSMLEMIIAQSSNCDSIVLDCFAGSGTTLLAAQNLGRKWIGVDQSDISAKVINGRLRNVKYNFIDYPQVCLTKYA
jgi:adenine-specific DNA-methyltransferase